MHGRHGTVDWGITRRLALGSVPAVCLTLGVIAVWPGTGMSSRLITVILGVVLLGTVGLLLYRDALMRLVAAHVERLRPAQVTALTVCTGAVLGCLVTLTSVGAGALGMTALLLLYPRSAPVRLVGSDIAHAVPLTFLAGVGHWLLGDVDLALVGALLAGSIPGVIVGSVLSVHVPGTVLRVVLAAVLFISALKLLT